MIQTVMLPYHLSGRRLEIVRGQVRYAPKPMTRSCTPPPNMDQLPLPALSAICVIVPEDKLRKAGNPRHSYPPTAKRFTPFGLILAVVILVPVYFVIPQLMLPEYNPARGVTIQRLIQCLFAFGVGILWSLAVYFGARAILACKGLDWPDMQHETWLAWPHRLQRSVSDSDLLRPIPLPTIRQKTIDEQFMDKIFLLVDKMFLFCGKRLEDILVFLPLRHRACLNLSDGRSVLPLHIK
jgi:hypothetical protein